MKLFRKQNWLAAMLGVLALVSCDKNPSGPSSSATNDKLAKTATSSGIEVYRSVQTFEQIKRALEGPDALGKINVPAVGSLKRAGVNFKPALAPFQQEVQALQQKAHGLGKTQGDTVIYDKRWIDPLTGINHHHWISYNIENGKATVYLVASNHPSNNPLGTRFEADCGQCEIYHRKSGRRCDRVGGNAKDYRAGYRLRYEEGRIIPDAYQPGSEPRAACWKD
jgi:hypothetical protein